MYNNYYSIPVRFTGCGASETQGEATISQNNNKKCDYQIVEKFQVPSFSEEELCNEQWKQIKGFPKYFVSNLGRVYSSASNIILKPHISRSNKKSQKFPHPIVFLYDYSKKLDNGRYPRKYFSILHLVAEYFVPIPKFVEGIKICPITKDGNNMNCRVTNIVWISRVVSRLIEQGKFNRKDKKLYIDLDGEIEKAMEKLDIFPVEGVEVIAYNPFIGWILEVDKMTALYNLFDVSPYIVRKYIIQETEINDGGYISKKQYNKLFNTKK